ncbi:MAG: RNase H family protein [Candidatus Acidiferrales bacterium]
MKTERIFCDGAGQNVEGKGSGFAWFRESDGHKNREQVDGLTNNQAEYRAVLSALESFKPGASVQIVTDSELIVNQLRGKYKVHDPDLAALREKILRYVQKRRLSVTYSWVPRAQNKAGRLLE